MRDKDTFAATSAVNQGPHELLTVPTAAARLSLAEKTLWSWIAARRITVVRLGRAVRIPGAEIQRIVLEGTTSARRSA